MFADNVTTSESAPSQVQIENVIVDSIENIHIPDFVALCAWNTDKSCPARVSDIKKLPKTERLKW